MKPEASVDFETSEIGPRPYWYPPVPVGVAIVGDGIDPIYYAWGHASKNNCERDTARRRLKDLYRTHRIIFHHASFDIEVGTAHLQLPFPTEYDDTMFKAFIFDPRADDLGLKPLADDLLGRPPRERDALRDWILTYVPGATEKTWSAFIPYAPGDLAGRYAIGDVVRTIKLNTFFNKQLDARDKRWLTDGQQTWRDAYNRELKLMPVLQRMEARGIRVDVRRLERDVPAWQSRVIELDKWIVDRLGGVRKVSQFAKNGEFNVGSSKQLANALEASGLVANWHKTAKGNRSTKREHLLEELKDPKLGEALAKRGILIKYISTYGEKWLTTCDVDGFVYPRINQTRNTETDRTAGARTGRLSYSDSWQAIPNVDRIPYDDLPVLREYVLPDDDGDDIIERDYSQQEFRILAHYEQGPLLAKYQADPHIDMHQSALEMMNEMGFDLDPKKDRRPVKDIGFGLIYGMGKDKTAKKIKRDLHTTRQLIDAYLSAIPGLKTLLKDIKNRCARDEPIRTWGGRLYWVEPPKYVEKFKRVMEFDYKMINVLIQGSAGDCTKEAMIRIDEVYRAKPIARIALQIHDSLAASVRRSKRHIAMKLMRDSMESVPFDVKMTSDGKWSSKNWGAVKAYDD